MTGPYRLNRPTSQPSSTGIPGCYRREADDDGVACALCYSPDTQQTLMRNFPTCAGCVAGQWAARIYYAQRGAPS